MSSEPSEKSSEPTEKQKWLDLAYAECTKLGHHAVGNPFYHNGACQIGYQATTTVPIHKEEIAELPVHQEN